MSGHVSMRLARCLLVVAVSSLAVLTAGSRSAVVDLPPGGPGTPSPAVGRVRELLANATLPLGDIQVPVIKFNFSDFRCHGISLGPITSAFIPPVTVDVSVTELKTQCDATWYHETIERKNTTGPFSINITAPLVVANVTLFKDDASLIVGAKLIYCDAKAVLKTSFGPNANLFEKGIVDLLDANIHRIVNDTVCSALQEVAEDELGSGLKNLSNALELWMGPVTPAPTVTPADIGDALDLQRTPLVTFLKYMASTELGAAGLDKLIEFALPFSSISRSGLTTANVSFQLADVANTTLPYGLGNVTATIGVERFNVTGLASFNGLTLFEATAPQSLRSTVGLDTIRATMTGFVELAGHNASSEPLVQWFEAELCVNNVTLIQESQMVVLKDQMAAIRGAPELNISCLATAFEEWNTTLMEYTSVMTNTTSFNFTGGNVDADLDGLLTRVLAITLDSLDPVLPDVLRGLLDGPVRQDLNTARAKLLADATCGYVDGIPLNLPPNAAWSTVAGCIAVTIASVILIKFQTDRERASEFVRKPDEPVPVVVSDSVPLKLRTTVVILLVSTLGLFIVGVLAHGGAVNLEITIDGSPKITLPPLYYLSLYGSIRDTFNAKVYALSVFIGISNLIGPPLRVATLAFVCVAPGWALTQRMRVQMTLLCDLLGKWVFAQAFVAMLMMIAFRYNITLTPADAPVKSTADIFLVFDWWGWWGILTCTTLGLVASHLVLYSLNRVSAASSHDDGGRHVDAQDLHRASTAEVTVVIALLATSIVAIVFGSTMPAYIFEYKGMTKLLAAGTNSSYKTEYTFWTTITRMPDEHVGHETGIAILQMATVLVAFVAPIVQGIVAILLYNVPMTAKPRRWATAVLQFISAWSALDVFIISVVLGFLQIGLFADFVVGHKCDALSPILHSPKVEHLLEGDPKCLDVRATLLPGLLALGLPAVAIHVLSVYVMVKARRTSRYEAIRGVTRPFPLHDPPSNQDIHADRVALLDESDRPVSTAPGLLN
mmetsp:Transcript_28890/g.86733  ORF Transcript_28890/g.86733 Transcript_28890/m.86733 type:complete len:1006 (+) Transcript_28890:18-3035(+)